MPTRGYRNIYLIPQFWLIIFGASNGTSILDLQIDTSIIFSDVDECEADVDDCNTNAVCTNTFGSFTCTGKINFYQCTSLKNSFNCCCCSDLLQGDTKLNRPKRWTIERVF